MSTVRQFSFAGGEIAPALHGRVDTAKYQTALRRCKNAMVMKSGGVTNRPGSQFIGEVYDSGKKTRLIPFVFSDEDAYCLEFSEEKMRVIRNGVYVMDSASETVSTLGPGTDAAECTTSGSPNWDDGDHVVFSGLTNNSAINGRVLRIDNNTENTFTLHYLNGDDFEIEDTDTSGTVERVFKLDTPYQEDELFELHIAQQGDVLIITHRNHEVKKLSRTDHDDWSLDAYTFEPSIDPPDNVAASGTAGTADVWVVTAVEEETFEESVASSSAGANSVASSGSPRTISWDSVTGAREYNVYKSKNGVFGYIGTAVGTSFVDNGITPDVTDTPPIERNPFETADNYPATVGFYQQRLSFGNTNNNPEMIWTSRAGHFSNFTVSSPLQDDDAVTFTMASRKIAPVRSLSDLNRLIVLTASGEHVVEGDEAGILRPGEINPRQVGYNGSSMLQPLFVAGNLLYVQARGSVIRDFVSEAQSQFQTGVDLTIFSSHLFRGRTIVDWAYQDNPDSIVWAVRDDGVLLGFTYVPEQQVFAWHRHSFRVQGAPLGSSSIDRRGVVESVCVIPEGKEDAVYVVVKRFIQHEPGFVNPFAGTGRRYVERLSARTVSDIADYTLLDSHLTYDGRRVTSDNHTMQMQATVGVTDWVYTDLLELHSGQAFFTENDVGSEIHLKYVSSFDENEVEYEVRFSITEYVSQTVVRGHANKTVNVLYRTATTKVWAKAVKTVTGLSHLEGCKVSVFGDGYVVANPLNEKYEVLTVANAALTLPRCYGVIHVGLPYVTDVETLDIDTAQGETLADKKMKVGRVTLNLLDTRGMFVGNNPDEPGEEGYSVAGMYEPKIRNKETYDQPVALKTGKATVGIQPEWNSNGRVLIRQIDPLPMTLLDVSIDGMIPFRG